MAKAALYLYKHVYLGCSIRIYWGVKLHVEIIKGYRRKNVAKGKFVIGLIVLVITEYEALWVLGFYLITILDKPADV